MNLYNSHDSPFSHYHISANILITEPLNYLLHDGFFRPYLMALVCVFILQDINMPFQVRFWIAGTWYGFYHDLKNVLWSTCYKTVNTYYIKGAYSFHKSNIFQKMKSKLECCPWLVLTTNIASISNSQHNTLKLDFITALPIFFLAVCASLVNYRILTGVRRLYLCTKMSEKKI